MHNQTLCLAPLMWLYKKTELVGNDLLSQGATPQVPSALANLTTGFEMDPGVPSPLLSPTSSVAFCWFNLRSAILLLLFNNANFSVPLRKALGR